MFGRRYKRQIEELEASIGRLLSQLDEERNSRIAVNVELIDRVERLEEVYAPLNAAIARYRQALRDEIMHKYQFSGEPPPIWLREIRDLTRRVNVIEDELNLDIDHE